MTVLTLNDFPNPVILSTYETNIKNSRITNQNNYSFRLFGGLEDKSYTEFIYQLIPNLNTFLETLTKYGVARQFQGIYENKSFQLEAKILLPKERIITEFPSITQNFKDNLTQLFTRNFLYIFLQKEIANYKRSGEKFSIVYIDLDNFKQVNDTYGHSIGDNLLRRIALNLSATKRKNEELFRVGGDEFVIFAKGDKAHTKNLETRFKTNLMTLKNVFPEDIQFLDISSGIATCPEDGITINELLKCSDCKMYDIKNEKKSQGL